MLGNAYQGIDNEYETLLSAFDKHNADPERKDLNEELIRFPEVVKTRTQAIQYRIEHAGITRKIKESQIRALQIMLSGTPEDMQRIQNSGKLDE